MADPIFKFDLGLKAKDLVTGFEGVITYRVQYMTGCNQYGINPGKDKNGNLQKEEQFDENRLQIIPGKALMIEGTNTPQPGKATTKNKTGGPQKNVSRQ